VRLGEPCRVGRGARASHAIPEDPYLSSLHFELTWDGRHCLLRDLKSANGTFLDGERISEAGLVDGQEIRAGQSRFVVILATEETQQDSFSVRDLLRTLEQSQPLYAILDAARSTRVLELLSAAKEPFQCLYTGESAVALATCAPYLVRLPAKSRLLRNLVREGWSQSWGVYLTCEASLAELRKHLRHFLMVKTEAGEDLYFRFYDPRVLRVFLPKSTAQQVGEFFGPIREYFLEGPEPGSLLGATLSEPIFRRRSIVACKAEDEPTRGRALSHQP